MPNLLRDLIGVTALGLIGCALFAVVLLVIRSWQTQREWECRPRPGYCDIDTDYR